MAEPEQPPRRATRSRKRRPTAAELEAQRKQREELEQREEREELGELRALSIRVFLALSVAMVLLDALGRLFRDPSFRIEPLVFGMVFGTLLALLGLEGASKLLGK